jgi:lipid A 4'-phosphatase
MADARQAIVQARPDLRQAVACGLRAYLRQPRVRAILACFLVSSLLLAAFTGIDLGISRLFYDGGFYMADQPWTRWLHRSVRYFIVTVMVSVLAIYLFNRLSKRRLLAIDGRKVVYLFLVLILGAGLIVNVALKDHFGRARPRDIEEFGGSQHFTPAFVIADGCDRNCSFASGDSAGAFLSLALILAVGRNRKAATAGIGFGVLVSAARIASGAHFFSDTVVSFFVMLIVADALHYFLLSRAPESVAPVPARGTGILVPAVGTPPVPP